MNKSGDFAERKLKALADEGIQYPTTLIPYFFKINKVISSVNNLLFAAIKVIRLDEDAESAAMKIYSTRE